MPFRPLALLLLAFPALACAQQTDARLKTTLEKLDAASARFTSAQADMTKELYTAAVMDTETQHGKVYFLREHGATQFGILLLDSKGSPERIAEFKSGVIRDLTPKLACYSTVNASSGKVEAFLTLGFGGSGKDLAKAWKITDNGPKTIDGIATEELELLPIEESVKQNVKRVTLWIDLDRDVSIQQKFYLPTRDTQTAHYSNIRLNAKTVDTKPFAITGKPCGK